jgi:type IV pilus assembly protein PilA
MKRLIANLNVGFTLIELMIVVAVVTVTLVMAVPAYSNYSIRVKISEALAMSTIAKSSTAAVCEEDRTVAFLTNQRVGYKFRASDYVQNIALSGICDAPIIIVSTRATGAKPNPVLTITGSFADDANQITWTCVSTGLNIHTPATCQS